MTFPLPVDTPHVRPRTRQYHLFRWDLGEGVERATLKVGALITAPWLLLCALVGVPIGHGLFIWLAPPAAATWRAMSRDESGRLRLRAWADRADFARPSRRRPIVNGDTAPAAAPTVIETDLTFLIVDSPKEQLRAALA